jgi:hypothetical protein
MCYAHKGMYVFPNVKQAQARRLAILLADLDGWRRNMVELLRLKLARKGKRDRVFRWHDSGDLQSAEHLAAIVAIARALPEVRFWLPTKEYGLIRSYRGKFPPNLTVRVSSPNVGQGPISSLPKGVVASTVGADQGKSCYAYRRGGQCGACRACWDKNVESVDYPPH